MTLVDTIRNYITTRVSGLSKREARIVLLDVSDWAYMSADSMIESGAEEQQIPETDDDAE